MNESPFCIECGRPWGFILERGELPSQEREAVAREGMAELFREYLDYADERICEVITENVPLEALEVLNVTEALARFADEHFGSWIGGEGPAWWAVRDIDIPAWCLKGRKRRWAYLTGCCNIDLDEFVKEVLAPLSAPKESE